MTSIEMGRVDEAVALLQDSYARIGAHDTIDQVEIVAARTWLGEQLGVEWTDGRKEVDPLLTPLPSAVRDQLCRLGIMN